MAVARGALKRKKFPRLLELAAMQAGCVTAAQARAVGYSPRSLVHHVAAGHLLRISRGLYRLAGFPNGPHEETIAAWLKLQPRGAVVSHETALALHGLACGQADDAPIHLTLPRTKRPRSRRPEPTIAAHPIAAHPIAVHTTTVPIPSADVTSRAGVRLTTLARTIVDVAELGADPGLVLDATERAITAAILTPADLRRAVEHRSARVRTLVEGAIQEACASR